MKGLLIIGAGGHGKVLADTAYKSGYWESIAFLDDNLTGKVLKWPILGKTAEAREYLEAYTDLAVAIGNNSLRVSLLRKFSMEGFNIPVICHPTATISEFAIIGAGSVVFANSAVNPGAVLGLGCIVNTGATIDHDCIVGEGVHLSPGVHLAGDVGVGDLSWLGVGVSVIHQITIGQNVVIGAGAVIIKSVIDNVTVAGVPGRIIKQHE